MPKPQLTDEEILAAMPQQSILALAESLLAIGKAQTAGRPTTARERAIMENAERELKLRRPR